MAIRLAERRACRCQRSGLAVVGGRRASLISRAVFRESGGEEFGRRRFTLLMLKVAIFIHSGACPSQPHPSPSRTLSAHPARGDWALSTRSEGFERWTASGVLQLPGLSVETLERRKLLIPSQPGLLHRGFEDAGGLVVDLDSCWHASA